MRTNNVELLVYIKGQKPAIEYRSQKDFKTYIEGRENSEFEIEVVNHNPHKVEAVVSVDGLSVLDGQHAGDESPGYVIEPYGRLRIPGWVRNSDTAAKFTFTGRKGGSYVELTTGQATNKGVIGLMAFSDADYRVAYVNNGFHGAQRFGGSLRGSGVPRGFLMNSPSSGDIDPSWSYTSDSASLMGSASLGSASAMNASFSASNAVDAEPNIRSRGLGRKGFSPAPEVTQTLGAGYGEETSFQTREVKFNRGDMLVLMAVYYDDKRGLQKRGIEITRPSQARYATSPDPFPSRTESAVGCPPPPGWRP